MSEKVALEYIANSRPEMPIFQKALIALNHGDVRKTRRIAWISVAVSAISLLASVISLVLKP